MVIWWSWISINMIMWLIKYDLVNTDEYHKWMNMILGIYMNIYLSID